MIINRRFYKALALALLISSLSPIGASAREVMNTTTENGITISISADGYFGLSSSYNGGRILYYTKSGETEDKLTTMVYPENVPVKFYDSKGNLTSTRTDLGGEPVYSDSDYSNWIPLGYTIDAPNNSAYNEAEGYKVMQPNKKTDSAEWIYGYRQAEKGYLQINAVYQYSDGSYSSPISKTFYYDNKATQDAGTPIMTINEASRTANEVTLNVDCKSGASGEALQYVIATLPNNGGNETINISDSATKPQYIAKYNGTYSFKLVAKNGQSITVPYTISGLTYAYEPPAGANTDVDSYYTAPEVEFSNMPDSVPVGSTFLLHVKTSAPSTISYNGTNYEGGTDFDIEIDANGSYNFHVVGKNGLSTDSTVEVSCFPDEQGSKIDIMDYWKSGKKTANFGEKKLPQTGGLAFATVIGGGIACLGAGVFLTRRSKKNKTKEV